MTDKEALAENIRKFLKSDDGLLMTGKDWETIVKALEQEDVLDKIRAEINEYGSLWVEYKIEGHSERDIEKIVEEVLKQAKRQILGVIDKYRQEGRYGKVPNL